MRTVVTSGWRQETRSRAAELEALLRWSMAHCGDKPGVAALSKAIYGHLDHARDVAAVSPSRWWRRDLSGDENPLVEGALRHLDAAETSQLRIVSIETLQGQVPSIEAQVFRYLPKADPRRQRVEEIGQQVKERPLTEAECETLICAYHAAASQREREVMRLGSFFVVLVRATVGVTLVALLVVAFGALWPRAIPLCFHPEDKGVVACATAETPATKSGAPKSDPGGDLDDTVRLTASSADYPVVALAGLLAAVVAGIATLRKMRGTSTPYRVPLALAILKLPAGALTAVVGLILMRGGFVPGLTALDSPAQIVAWAVIFGYSQQLITGLVDQRAQGVLADVGGRGAGGDRETSTG